MKIRLLSDLHLEFYDNPQIYDTQGEDVLVLAGDIHQGAANTTRALMKFHAQQKNIVYLPGNHEYYRTSIHDFDSTIGLLARNNGIHLLNPGMVRIGGVTFIGAALWTNFRGDAIAQLTCARGISDFSVIHGFNTHKCADLHERQFRYIQDAYLAAAEGPKVICTHFLPAVECISEQYRGPDLLNYYFANDYGSYISTLQDTTWLFGHTHDCVDITLGTTRVVSNPYGYYQNKTYQEMIIQL